MGIGRWGKHVSMSVLGKRAWIPWVGIGLALVLLSPYAAEVLTSVLNGVDTYRLSLAILSAGFLLTAVGAAIALSGSWRRKYDLKDLEELQEKIDLEAAEVPEVRPEADEIVCLSCGTAYSAKLPVCPNCKREAGR